MKKRLGFVSNSSSSSFTAIGYEVTVKEIDDEHVKLYAIDQDCGEGELYFRPSKDIINYIKEHPEVDYGIFFHEVIGSESIEIDKTELINLIESCPNKNIKIMSFDVSHYEPDLEEFLEGLNYED